jgi:hypothetical protein
VNELSLLDDVIAPFDEPGDWDDVLRRTRDRRRPRRRLVLATAIVVAALGGGPALGVLLTRGSGPHLPPQADRSNVVVVVQPHTGRVLLELAPWNGHAGFCYLVRIKAGCVPRTERRAMLLRPPLFGWTFDRRVVSGTAITLGGKHVPLTVTYFGGRIDATVFLDRRGYGPGFLREVELRDAAGRVVAVARA